MTMFQQLQALIVGNKDFEEIEKSRSIFCPFEAIGMVRQEIRHAHFLAYCMDPQRPHGFGTECLRALMRAAAKDEHSLGWPDADDAITRLDVHLMDFDGAQIRREWNGIDLVIIISDEKLIIAIELKVYAAEHSGQLGRYRKAIETKWPAAAGWKHLFLFLTRSGDEASADGIGWQTLALSNVAQELDTICQREIGSKDAQSLMAAYLSMLRRHHLTDERLEQIAIQLWDKHREALEFLMDRRPDSGDGVSGLLYERRDQIAKIMSESSGLDIVQDDGSPNIMRFAVRQWDQLPNFLSAQGWTSSNRLILIEIARNKDRTKLWARIVLGPGAQTTRHACYKALTDANLSERKLKELSDRFTRMATVRLIELMDDQADLEGPFDAVVESLKNYSRTRITKFDDVLRSLKFD